MTIGGILPGAAEGGHRRLNPFAGAALDRAADRRVDPQWIAARREEASTRVVPVWRARNLVAPGPGSAGGSPGFEPVFLTCAGARGIAEPEPEWIFLGLDPVGALFAAEVPDGGMAAAGTAVGSADAEPEPAPLAELGEFHDLHRVGAMLGQPQGSVLAYARAVVTWSRRHRYCGCCGHPTSPREGGHIRQCDNPQCEAQHFPRTDPAIIVLVSDGDRCLLGRKDIWPEGVYSTLAGFVEPGESLSEAVSREVREEAGIEVGSVTYRSSQPWPFPSSLMLGFHAVRTGGELRVDRRELSDARWFERDEVWRRREVGLRLPPRVSIARRLIEEWLDGDRREARPL